jgi:hypothetical protein
MKISIRKTRLVLACMNLGGGLLRLLAALVDMAFNYYPLPRDTNVDSSLRA